MNRTNRTNRMNRFRPSPFASFASLGLLASLAMATTGLTPASAFAEFVFWTNNGGDFLWHNPANWSPAHVPTAGDDAFNLAGGEIDIVNGGNVNSIQSNGFIKLSGSGTFNLNADSYFNGGLSMFNLGGTIFLENKGVLEIGTSFTYFSGWIHQTGLGAMVLKPNCVTTVKTGAPHYLRGGSFTNQGPMTLEPNATIVLGNFNQGDPFTSLINEVSGQLNLGANASFTDWSSGPTQGGYSSIDNRGNMKATGGTSVIEKDIAFSLTSTGALFLDGATLDVQSFGNVFGGQLGFGTYLLVGGSQLVTHVGAITSIANGVTVALPIPQHRWRGCTRSRRTTDTSA
ncbi:MAG: hypothetical protein U0575_15235 [Phycisphaerales bacterium]